MGLLETLYPESKDIFTSSDDVALRAYACLQICIDTCEVCVDNCNLVDIQRTCRWIQILFEDPAERQSQTLCQSHRHSVKVIHQISKGYLQISIDTHSSPLGICGKLMQIHIPTTHIYLEALSRGILTSIRICGNYRASESAHGKAPTSLQILCALSPGIRQAFILQASVYMYRDLIVSLQRIF